MPSIHVVIATLIASIGWRTNRWLGIVFSVFAAVIVFGSVPLGWHYAVDSITGIFLAITFWKVAGIVVRAQARMPTFSAWRAASA